MLSRHDADEKARERLKLLSRRSPFELVLIDERTLEEEFGWVYFYNTSEFVRTGDRTAAAGGNGPLFVDRETGKVHVAGTGRPLVDYIEHFRRHRTFAGM